MKEKIKEFVDKVGVARLIIGAFFVLVLIGAEVYDLGLASLLSSVLRRYGMWVILVLAMVPAIQCGIGPNFGISLGIVCGLFSALLSIEFDVAGRIGVCGAFIFAAGLSMLLAAVVGGAYGMLLNKVKGSEMTVSTYVGFSVIALMNIVWATFPFNSGEIKWPIGGEGVRMTVNLQNSFGGFLDNLWDFKIGFGSFKVTVPTGLLLFAFFICFIVYLFLQSKTGKAMSTAGANPLFARASGINVDKMRILGTSFSTSLAAVGIITYAQTYGFLQMYNAALTMGFQSVAAILIGGASTSRAKISNVLIGTFLFQGLLVVALPVANKVFAGTDLSDIMRMIIQNGIIIYAITKAKGSAGNEE